MSAASANEMARRIVAGSRRDLVDALNLVESAAHLLDGPKVELLDLLHDLARSRSWTTGITGAPGVGKSTLVGALAAELRRRGRTVAVLAIDPTSPRTGGALLGDRIRIAPDPRDPGILVRSMASRGALGGLADATADAVVVLRAAFDEVVVETVGVGQSELDVAELVDSTVLVVQPGTGDTLQLMKAGITEVPDVIALSKADLADAGATLAQLRATLGAAGSGGRAPEVVCTSALGPGAPATRGIDALLDALELHRGHLGSSGSLCARRERSRRHQARARLVHRCGVLALETLGAHCVEDACEARPEASSHGIAAELEARFVARLRGDGEPGAPRPASP